MVAAARARRDIEMPPIDESDKMASIDNFHSQLDKRMGRCRRHWSKQGRADGMADQKAMPHQPRIAPSRPCHSTGEPISFVQRDRKPPPGQTGGTSNGRHSSRWRIYCLGLLAPQSLQLRRLALTHGTTFLILLGNLRFSMLGLYSV